jgi:hypothetical protein
MRAAGASRLRTTFEEGDMIRMVAAGLAGVFCAFLVVALVEAVGHQVYAPATTPDLSTPEAMRAFVASMPLGAFLFVLGAYLAGTIGGAVVAAAIARRRAMIFAILIGGLILLGSVANFAFVPHPTWFVAATLIGVPLAALATGRLGGTWFER